MAAIINEEACLKDVTRREFFSELYSRDFLSGILGAWYGFNGEVKKANKLSCEEAAMRFGRKATKKISKFSETNRKEG